MLMRPIPAKHNTYVDSVLAGLDLCKVLLLFTQLTLRDDIPTRHTTYDTSGISQNDLFEALQSMEQTVDCFLRETEEG